MILLRWLMYLSYKPWIEGIKLFCGYKPHQNRLNRFRGTTRQKRGNFKTISLLRDCRWQRLNYPLRNLLLQVLFNKRFVHDFSSGFPNAKLSSPSTSLLRQILKDFLAHVFPFLPCHFSYVSHPTPPFPRKVKPRWKSSVLKGSTTRLGREWGRGGGRAKWRKGNGENRRNREVEGWS